MVVRVEVPASAAPAEAPAPAPAATTTPAAVTTTTPAAPATEPAPAAPAAPTATTTAIPTAPVQTPAPAAATPSAETVTAQFQAKGLSLDKYVESYAANGELTATDYEELANGGFSKGYVDSFIAGQNALRAQEENEVFSTVGGKEEYAKLTSWAKANVSPAEIEAYNEALDNMPIATIKLVVAGLKARFEAANGSEPTLVGGAPAGAPNSYQSISQVTDAMKDPRYKRDPAYRAEVEARLATSNVF